MRKVFNFLGGFFIGGLTGAVAGVLLAPYGGEELQNRIQSRWDALVEEGREAAAARQAELEAQLEAYKSGASPTTESLPRRP
jgi:gas vesicle protein